MPMPWAPLITVCITEIAAHLVCGFVERFGGDAQILRAEQTDDAVTQIRQPQQHENHEHDDERGRADRLEERRHPTWRRARIGRQGRARRPAPSAPWRAQGRRARPGQTRG